MIAALEVGGSHAAAALVHADGTVSRFHRRALNPHDPAEPLLAAFAGAAASLHAPSSDWAVAMPGPFDYAAGIGRFTGVGKFESLRGVAVGAELARRIDPAPSSITFVNDAHAFGIGAWTSLTDRPARLVAITLGTGVGSAFLADGVPVVTGDDVPAEGRADLLRIAGRPLEDVVSTRAMTAAYARRRGAAPADMQTITAHAAAGVRAAHDVIEEAMGALGAALAPWLHRFGAHQVVVGGAIAGAWDVIGPALEPALRAGAGDAETVGFVRPTTDTERLALQGAAHEVRRRDAAVAGQPRR